MGYILTVEYHVLCKSVKCKRVYGKSTSTHVHWETFGQYQSKYKQKAKKQEITIS